MPHEIKKAPMHKLIKRAGAARVSEESALALGRALEEVVSLPTQTSST